MKKIILPLLSSLFVILFSSCHSDADKLPGMWTISNIMSEETYKQGDRAAATYKETDKMLQDIFKGGTLELRKDKTATLKTRNQEQSEYTWKMDKESGKILELYKKDKTEPAILFWPAVASSGSLFYMKGIDTQISAKMIFAEDNTACIVDLGKKE